MRRVIILPAAIEDLDHIFLHTARTWSEEQAIRYVDRLENGFYVLARLSTPGRVCVDLQPGLRRDLIESHVAYFFVNEEELTVARVLHKKMSPDRHTFN